MKKILIYCICVVLIVVVVSIFGQPETTNARGQAAGGGFTVAGGGVCKEGELLVRFAPRPDGKQPTTAEKNQILTSLGGAAEKYSFKIVPGLSLVKLPAGQKVEDALKIYNNTGGILYAGPNYKLHLMSTFPNDTWFGDLWGMHNTGQQGGTPDADIDAPEAWDTATDSDIIVALIDTGIDYTHPDLAANMWINPGEDHPPLGVVGPEDFNEVDDDGNNKVDDIYGWNFYDKNNNTMDESSNGHGTHLAGTIGAVGNNGKGVVGVCWDVKIMSLRIYGNYMEANSFLDGWIKAVQYAIDNGAKVLSNATGYYVDPPYDWPAFPEDYHQPFKAVIAAAGEAGVLFVVAAGNEGRNNDVNEIYPANFDCDNIIVVMATDRDDERSVWEAPESSNFGPTTVDLAAPGTDILSCIQVTYPWVPPYASSSGTSCAQPHVAGACALLWSANPSLTHLEVKNILMIDVDEIDALKNDPTYGRLCVTGGRLNVDKAIRRADLYPDPGERVFGIKNAQGVLVVWFDDLGNLFLKGTFDQWSSHTATGNDEFRVQGPGGYDVAIIDATDGNMYITGTKYENHNMVLYGQHRFIIKDSNGYRVAYINGWGDLYLKGNLYENQ